MPESEGGLAGHAVSITMVPSDDENTYICDHLKVECNKVPWEDRRRIIASRGSLARRGCAGWLAFVGVVRPQKSHIRHFMMDQTMAATTMDDP